MTRVLDYMFRQGPAVLAAFRADGADAVARYLDPFNPKGITRAEVVDIHAAGLGLHLFYETTGGTGDPAAYFTRAQGYYDGQTAVRLLRDLDAPAGTVVYFAIDVNVEPSSIDEYANGIEAATTAQITPGLYGYQRLCEYARANYPNLGRHLAQTYGARRIELDLWQHQQQDVAGVTVDVNEAYVAGWRPGGSDDMTPENYAGATEDLVKSTVRVILAQEYGPALEAELVERFAAAGSPDIGATVAAAIAGVAAKLAK